MVSVIEYVREKPVVRLIQQFLKVRQVRRAVLPATFAASQERLDSIEVGRRPDCITQRLSMSRITKEPGHEALWRDHHISLRQE